MVQMGRNSYRIYWWKDDIHTSIVSLPSCTAVSRRGRIVSRPGKPGGAFSPVFSSTVCGAETDITHGMYYTGY